MKLVPTVAASPIPPGAEAGVPKASGKFHRAARPPGSVTRNNAFIPGMQRPTLARP
jgi:hypothetical protein